MRGGPTIGSGYGEHLLPMRSWRGILVFTHLAREGRMTVTIDGGELLAALGAAVAAWQLAARGQQTGNVPTMGRRV